MPELARLILEDNTVFEGEALGKPAAAAGEVVFNTGMVGYPETFTDPSYTGQILVMTYPLIGNYGVPPYREDEHGLPIGFESKKVRIAGLVVSEVAQGYSHHTAARGLATWLDEQGVPAICGIDTRALTKRLREKGTMLGKIELAGKETSFVDPNVMDLVSTVTADCVTVIEAKPDGEVQKAPVIVLLDMGCKTSIMRSLIKRGLTVLRVPYDHYFLNQPFDGLLISNGPGDPKTCTATIKQVEHALALGKPILGICLGHQILALASGAETYKLKFGHRSQNQPCIEHVRKKDGGIEKTKRCVITSQNHGYAVRAEDIPEDWNVWFTNANDGTVEGIRHVSKPFLGVQFHPEAAPGPVDTAWIFDEFAEQVRKGMQ